MALNRFLNLNFIAQTQILMWHNASGIVDLPTLDHYWYLSNAKAGQLNTFCTIETKCGVITVRTERLTEEAKPELVKSDKVVPKYNQRYEP